MNHFASFIIIIATVIFITTLSAQQHDSLEILTEESYNFLEDYEVSENLLSRIESLYDGLLHTIDINSADKANLLEIPLMTEELAELIILHRSKYGRIFSLSELYSISGVNEFEIKLILPFLTVTDYQQEGKNPVGNNTLHIPLNGIKFESYLRTILSSENNDLFDSYQGSPTRIVNKFTYKPDSLYAINIITEKDAGEKNFTDHLGGNIILSDIPLFDSFLLGDFNIKFGHGLVSWTSFRQSKSALSNSLYNIESNVSTGALLNEFNLLRGSSLSGKFADFSYRTFFSSTKLDGRILNENGRWLYNIEENGYHRTTSEIEKSNNISSLTTGAILNWRSDKITIGTLFLHNTLSGIVNSDIPSTQSNSFSISYKLRFEKFHLSGESALLNMAGLSHFFLLDFRLNPSFNFNIATRLLKPELNTIYSNPLCEFSHNFTRETGYTFTANYKQKNFRTSLLFDLFSGRNPVYHNSSGSELLLAFYYKFSSRQEIELLLRYKNKPQLTPEEVLYFSLSSQRYSGKIFYTYYGNKLFYSRSEFHFLFVNNGDTMQKETGTAIGQLLKFQATEILEFITRIVFYKTDSFQSTIYLTDTHGSIFPTFLPAYYSGTYSSYLIRISPLHKLTISAGYTVQKKIKTDLLSPALEKYVKYFGMKISFQL